MNLTIVWVILLIIALIFLIIAIAVFEAHYKGKLTSAAIWVYVLFGLGVGLLIAALIVFMIQKAPGLCYRGKTCYPCDDPGKTCTKRPCKFSID